VLPPSALFTIDSFPLLSEMSSTEKLPSFQIAIASRNDIIFCFLACLNTTFKNVIFPNFVALEILCLRLTNFGFQCADLSHSDPVANVI